MKEVHVYYDLKGFLCNMPHSVRTTRFVEETYYSEEEYKARLEVLKPILKSYAVVKSTYEKEILEEVIDE